MRGVAFAKARRGNFDLYTIPLTGGEPRRITTHSAKETPWSYTPDGREILFTAALEDPASSVLFPKASMTELYAVSRTGGRPRQVLGTPAEELSFVGTSGAFV